MTRFSDPAEWNFRFRVFRRRFKKWRYELAARLAGCRFYCRSLHGSAPYNLCVNSDMTVSCNCQDYDGKGHIGDLSEQSMQEIFDGPVARHFRHDLARGRLPLWTCTRCMELERVTKEESVKREHGYHLPRYGIMVENTILCNLKCADCARKTVLAVRKKHSLSLDDVRLVSRVIKECGVKVVAYFNLGEPFVSPSIREELEILRADNPATHIVLSTNGHLLDTDEKREAALLLDRICFSIDGMDNRTLRKYQRGGDFGRAYDNMKSLAAFRNRRGRKLPVIEWKYVVFNWNDRKDMILKAIELAKEAGVDEIHFFRTNYPFYGFSWRCHWTQKEFFASLGTPTLNGYCVHLS